MQVIDQRGTIVPVIEHFGQTPVAICQLAQQNQEHIIINILQALIEVERQDLFPRVGSAAVGDFDVFEKMRIGVAELDGGVRRKLSILERNCEGWGK